MSIQLQNRDLQIFRELQSCRFLTMGQIADLCFEGRREAAKKRLQKLQHNGLVLRYSPGMLHPSIYLVGKRAHALMNKSASMPSTFKYSTPSLTTLKHEILIRDFRTAVFRDAKRAGIEVDLFTLSPQDLRFEIGNKMLRSDAYFEIKAKDKIFRYFLEVDLGTEPQLVIEDRVRKYRKLSKLSLVADLSRGQRKNYQSFPFRILFAFTSNRRLSLFQKILYERGVRDFALASTVDLAVCFPLCRIWTTPRTYKEAECLQLFL